jgi:hypothetical protein
MYIIGKTYSHGLFLKLDLAAPLGELTGCAAQRRAAVVAPTTFNTVPRPDRRAGPNLRRLVSTMNTTTTVN